MPMYFPPWDTDAEPNESNIKTWMDNLYGKFQPVEQARWQQGNIDSLFYAGEQRFINSYFNFYPINNFQNYFFNLIQQPINMVTGYQRQHRKSFDFVPIEGAKQDYADDLTTVIKNSSNYNHILEKFSVGCEQAAISGMVLAQPYLDYTTDPISGTLQLKIWSYNEFMVDPYFREPDMSDCNFVWCQQYLSKQEAMSYFPDQADLIKSMAGYGNRYGKFYFLPENYNLARNDLLVLSHVWFKTKRKKKILYNKQDGLTYDYFGPEDELEEVIQQAGIYDVFEMEVPTWKVAVVLNEQLLYLNQNPMGFDECPFVPIFWNYDPHLSQYDLRVRSLTRPMRDIQFLLNRRIILNHDISETSINSGWKYIENSIANPENLKYAGQGKDIIIKEGNDLGVIDKIVPNAVPQSDLDLANQLADFIFKVSGVNQELLGMASDSDTGIEVLLKQGAGLVTLQKYFDQFDTALKLLGRLYMRLVQSKWSYAKISRILGKEAAPEFFFKIYSKYDVAVQEGLNTTVQKQSQFSVLMNLNERLGGIIPAKFILENAPIHGIKDILEAVDQNQKAMAEMQKQKEMIEQAYSEAKIQNLHAKSVSDVAMARERHGRAESNIGLFEERLSMITNNRSMALKNKVEALEKLLNVINQFGEVEAAVKAAELENLNSQQIMDEDREKIDARMGSQSNNFMAMMQNNSSQSNMAPEQERSALL